MEHPEGAMEILGQGLGKKYASVSIEETAHMVSIASLNTDVESVESLDTVQSIVERSVGTIIITKTITTTMVTLP